MLLLKNPYNKLLNKNKLKLILEIMQGHLLFMIVQLVKMSKFKVKYNNITAHLLFMVHQMMANILHILYNPNKLHQKDKLNILLKKYNNILQRVIPINKNLKEILLDHNWLHQCQDHFNKDLFLWEKVLLIRMIINLIFKI